LLSGRTTFLLLVVSLAALFLHWDLLWGTLWVSRPVVPSEIPKEVG
jgi:hypothetical protein